MALAMLERDEGPAIAAEVAQAARRLRAAPRTPDAVQLAPSGAGALGRAATPSSFDWMHANLEMELGADVLAKRAGQSPRDFYRKFSRATGVTPARFVENLRLDQVRVLLGHSIGFKEIATQTGFGNAVRMSRAFERRFGVKPSMFRQMVPAAE